MSFCSWFVIVSRTKCDNDSNQAIIFAVLVRQSPEGETEIIIFWGLQQYRIKLNMNEDVVCIIVWELLSIY